jgi:dihydrofolate reductase
MGKLIAYNFITLNGFYKGLNEDTSWHRHGEDEAKYSEEMLALDNILLFGRKTYDLMINFWPTPAAKEMFPEVAKGMNRSEKIVFSNSPVNEELWENTKLMNGDIVGKINQMKQSSIKDLAILGSGSIINLFTDHQLIDEYQIMVDPMVIGAGVPIFNEIKRDLALELIEVKAFKSGVVLLYYKPIIESPKSQNRRTSLRTE